MATPTTKKIVLVTGGNGGIGFHACLNIAKKDNHHLILTGRDTKRVHDAAEKVRAVASASSIVEEGVLDLSSLTAIQAYADKLKQRSDVPKIDTIVLNAGVQTKDKTTTADGFESTFGVNHLGHFHFATLLRDRTDRFVIVSSDTHDPAEGAHAPAPNVSDLDQLAQGYEPFEGLQAYTTSKLCNLLFMFEWTRRFPNGPEFLAYSPNFTPDSSLSRDYSTLITAAVESCKQHGVTLNTSDAAGAFMSRLAVEDWASNGWKNGDYIRLTEVYQPSAQAKDAGLGCALWDKSEELVQRVLGKQ